MTSWQDTIRFSTTYKNFQRLETSLDVHLPKNYGVIFLGSGDYHHVSHLLIKRMKKDLNKKPLTIIVIDNHPDNMRFPFGIHCGSWVSHTAALPYVKHIHVVGITSNDIGIKHSWENRLTPLLKSKLTYWSIGVNVKWAKLIGLKNAFQSFADIDTLMSAFISSQYNQETPIYLSIDKDALSPACIRTNWDQGKMQTHHLTDLITTFGKRLIGGDITGEVSNYSYENRWKRLMSKLDGQDPIDPKMLIEWQEQQNLFNTKLLALLNHYL
ncbi:arginase family protein [Bartonella tamiae]|nr:arginase family protein [Bartonella tamiae]